MELQSRLLRLSNEIRDGNRISQTEFYNLLKDNFFGICRKYTRTDFDAEEAFQKACIKIIANLNQYSNSGSFCGWLARIFVNHAISESRYVGFELMGSEYDSKVADHFEEPEFFESDEMMKTREIYNSLNETNKSIVYMRVEDNMSFEKIGKVLNMPRSTVCRKYNRIIEQIKELVKQDGI